MEFWSSNQPRNSNLFFRPQITCLETERRPHPSLHSVDTSKQDSVHCFACFWNKTSKRIPSYFVTATDDTCVAHESTPTSFFCFSPEPTPSHWLDLPLAPRPDGPQLCCSRWQQTRSGPGTAAWLTRTQCQGWTEPESTQLAGQGAFLGKAVAKREGKKDRYSSEILNLARSLWTQHTCSVLRK